MPNYNYRSNDYMRRGQCSRPMTATSPVTSPNYSSCQEEDTPKCCMHDPLAGMPVAMAYVPWQEWKNIYPAEKALCRGTIFEELDKPFSGKGGCLK